MSSQCSRILTHLKREPITAAQAVRLYRCYRLAARIRNLRDQGHHIGTEMVTRGNKRYARYWLTEGRK